ncbi:MAG: 30S ribosomal protein S8 [Candidatus Micrarchaeota archaeon]|nr:30S ribosomal protein S8 [Candidatus Micrarchaeota archaeon]
MASRYLLAEVLNQIMLSERVGKKEILVKKSSRLIKDVLNVLKEEGYIEDFEPVEYQGHEALKVKLAGKIKELKAIYPRFPVKYLEIVDYEKQYLPSYLQGILILTTPQGVMSNKKAKELRIGGRLLAYVY